MFVPSIEPLTTYLNDSGFGQVTLGNLVMISIGLTFIYLAIKKGFEPLLLVPIGFGMLMGNVPFNSGKLSLSVYDGPAPESKILYFAIEEMNLERPDGPITVAPLTMLYAGDHHFRTPRTADDPDGPAWKLYDSKEEGFLLLDPPLALSEVKDLVAAGRVVMVHSEEFLTERHLQEGARGVVELPKGGQRIFVAVERENHRYNIVIEERRQDISNASVLWFLFRGVEWGYYPPLIFLGVGALIDFGPLLAQPRLILLGAAAQFGIFGALLSALFLGFSLKEAASIGIIGGADGPTAIFTCTTLAPHLLGAVALAAYSYMALVPIIQPPIMRLLTTREERLIRMKPPQDVSRTLHIVFPLVCFLLTAFMANAALPLLGMLFFGNLLRECLVTDRLAKTAQTAFIDIVTILLGVTVGAKTQASTFLTPQTLGIFVMGVVAFSVATATGVLFAKLMNLFIHDKINPLVGAAGVSAVPMAARVVHRVAQEEDPQNYLLMHAMGPNVAGVIGSALAAGVMLSFLM